MQKATVALRGLSKRGRSTSIIIAHVQQSDLGHTPGFTKIQAAQQNDGRATMHINLSASAAFLASVTATTLQYGQVNSLNTGQGVLAESAAYALTYHLGRLPAVHALAKKLENGLKEIGASITGPAETCMVIDCVSLVDTMAHIYADSSFMIHHHWV